MLTSETINELAEALSKAQGVMGGALKDSSNPFFKSKYADLASVWDACRKALSDNGLSVVQGVENAYSVNDDTIDSTVLKVSTRLMHRSGQWMQCDLMMNPKDGTPQAVGSAITYGRRYALAAMVGVYQTDDDAEAAHGRATGLKTDPRPDTSAVDPAAVSSYLKAFRDAMADRSNERILKIHHDLQGEHEVYSAVGDGLTTKEKNVIKDAVAAAREDAGKAKF